MKVLSNLQRVLCEVERTGRRANFIFKEIGVAVAIGIAIDSVSVGFFSKLSKFIDSDTDIDTD